jgi:hypothetical protein
MDWWGRAHPNHSQIIVKRKQVQVQPLHRNQPLSQHTHHHRGSELTWCQEILRSMFLKEEEERREGRKKGKKEEGKKEEREGGRKEGREGGKEI